MSNPTADQPAQTYSMDEASLLARLLATENITVEHRKCKTASFHILTRHLTLPIWQNVTKEMYGLLISHEVGHALFTTIEYGKATEKFAAEQKALGKEVNLKIFQDYLNVVEDARIERKIKLKYPGLRRDHYYGYKQLCERDFFNLRGGKLDSLSLIDRINLYFKAGHIYRIPFKNEFERNLIRRIADAETIQEIVELTKEIYLYSKKNNEGMSTTATQKTIMVEEGGDDEGDIGENGDGDDFDEGMDPLEEEFLGGEDGADDGDNGAGGDSESDDSDDTATDDEGSLEADGEGGQDGKKGKSKKQVTSQGEETDEDEGDADAVSKDASGKKDKGQAQPDKANTKNPGDGNDKETGPKSGDKAHSGKRQAHDANKDMGVQHDGAPEAAEASTYNDFQKKMEDLVDLSGIPPCYINIPEKLDVNNYIITYRQLLSAIDDEINQLANKDDVRADFMGRGKTQWEQFKKDSAKIVSYLVQEFEARKAADQYSRAKEAKTGVLNPTKLHTYKYAEDIFRRLTVLPMGKSHGLIMLIDLSGSMYPNMRGTIEQLLNLTLFCRRVGIPHRVFGFTNLGCYMENIRTVPLDLNIKLLARKHYKGKDGEPCLTDGFWLLELFSEKMRATEFADMASILLATYKRQKRRHYYDYSFAPGILRLNDTPLNEALFSMRYLIPVFRTQTKAQIVNMILLTDGGATDEIFWRANMGQHDWVQFEGNKKVDIMTGRAVIVKDAASKTMLQFKSHGWMGNEYTATLTKLISQTCGTRAVMFYLLNSIHSAGDIVGGDGFKESHYQEWSKEGAVTIKHTLGCDEIYLIKDGENLFTGNTSIESLVIKTDTTVGDIRTAFKKAMRTGVKNRVILSRFISMIA